MRRLGLASSAMRDWWGRGWGSVRGMPGAPRIYARGLQLVASAAPVTLTAIFLIGITLRLAPVLQVWLVKLIVDALAGAARGVHGQGDAAIRLAIFYALTLILPAGLGPVLQALDGRLSERAVATVDRQLMEAGRRLVDLGRIERPAFGDELRLLEQSPNYVSRLADSLLRGAGLSLQLGGLLLLLGRLHPLLPVALVCTSIPNLLDSQHLERLGFQSLRSYRSRLAREMDYCARLTTEAAAAKEIRVFGLGGFFLDRFQQRSAALLAETTRLHLQALAWSSLFAGMQAAALAGGFWYVASQASTHHLGLGDLSLYLTAVVQLQRGMGEVTYLSGTLYRALLHLRALFTFLDSAVPSIALAPAGAALPILPSLGEGLRIEGIDFRYPESQAPVLREATGLLPAGKVTALVGANGAGKSTLVKLLTRMYDPQEGIILLDGQPLAAYDLAALRETIGVVYQDFAHFALSLRENVAVGAGGLVLTNDRYEQALAWSGAAALLAKLPQGEATPLTRRFKGGVDLSGGEWQAVALARAFVRDASLIILDEPTAAVDAAAEAALFERFRELTRGRTALLISHRFSTVRMADHILVLEAGKVVEAGSHGELLAQGGRYAALYEMQAARYR